MKELIRGFIRDEEGLETVEVVVVLVIVVSLAFAFKGKIQEWWTSIADSTTSQVNQLKVN